MKHNVILRAALAATVALASVAAMASENLPKLMPGMKAPELKVSQWFKGKPVTEFKAGQVYVVEFWATWCGPCIVSIPHITKLAKQHGSKVFVIGVSVWERGEDIPAQVDKFVKNMGDKMDYNVALDSNEKFMANEWMTAAGQRGIPAAFIINQQGVIAWIGHPMEMDKPLEQIIEGKFDLNASIAGFKKEAEEAARQMEASTAIGEGVKLYRSGKKAEGLAALDAVAKKYPEMGMAVKMNKLMVVSPDGADAVKPIIQQMQAEGGADNRSALAQFAYRNAVPPRNGTKNEAVALMAADAAVAIKAPTNPIDYYYLGQAYGETGHAGKGLEMINIAIEAAAKDPEFSGDQYKAFRDALTALQKKYQDAKPGSGN